MELNFFSGLIICLIIFGFPCLVFLVVVSVCFLDISLLLVNVGGICGDLETLKNKLEGNNGKQ